MVQHNVLRITGRRVEGDFLERMYAQYKLPMMIVENGLGAVDRIENGEIHDPPTISVALWVVTAELM